MKVIIPVAGVGTRLKPHTHTIPKVLIQVAGKPIIAHILDELEELKISEVILVIGYLGDKIVDYVKSNYNFKVDFVEQERRLGLGHAIYLTRDYVQDDEPVLIILGDTLFDVNLKPVINGKYSSIAVKKIDNPQRFGIVKLNKDGFIEDMVEKPEEFIGNLAIVGIYYLINPSVLFDSLQYIIGNDIRTKGEYQLTDALKNMLENGEKMTAFEVQGWYDCGKPETLLATNRTLLEKKNSHITYAQEGTIIIPPTLIGNNVKIEYSIIGPYVTIAENVKIKKSIIEDSIISSNATVENISLKRSIIGDYSKVYGRFQKLNVGDSSEIDFT